MSEVVEGAEEHSASKTGEDIKRRVAGAALSKMISANIGDAVVVFSRAASHKHYSLADIEWMILPAVLAHQCYVAEMENKEHGVRIPVAIVTWAKVSPELDEKLSTTKREQQFRLRPEEWTSGEQHWLVDIVGDAPALSNALQTLGEGIFRDKLVKVPMRDAKGTLKIVTLASILSETLTSSPSNEDSQATT